ncbi:MAG: D-alanyl-D-alanine carboxypeptidase, partial [Vallitaleaceae bacterium]|nr:D-alanyl-D-alanine carboxypeptidase [Vallitaleaceae bacterium]
MKKRFLAFLQLSILTLSLSVLPIQATTTDPISISEPSVVAETAIVMDADSGQILYDKGSHEVRYPASITKILTALLALENLNPEDSVTFSETALNSISAGSS